VSEAQLPEQPSRSRVAETLSPEVISIGLIALLVLGALVSVWTGSGGGPGASAVAQASADLPPTSVGPPTAAPTPTPTPPPPTPSPTPPPSVTPPPSLAPTPAIWASTARTLLDAEGRLIAWREALRSELATDPRRADSLARQLRSTNSAVEVALVSIATLAAADAPGPLLDRLQGAHQEARTAALDTLAVALGDVKAYRDGARRVVAALEPLETLMRDLASTAGLPDPLPEIGASPSAPAAAP
jgi:hypothetical protein